MLGTSVTSTNATTSPRNVWSRTNPFKARLLERRRITAPHSDKETYHYVVDISGSGIRYEPGDCFGFFPRNDPAEVAEVLQACNATEDDDLRQALETRFCIRTVTGKLITQVAEASDLARQLKASKEERRAFAQSGTVGDLLASCDSPVEAQKIAAALRPLKPRLLSVASSPQLHPSHVHFTVDTLRFEGRRGPIGGVTTTWLADRVEPGAALPLYHHPAPGFRLDPSVRRIIMIGQGTGIAPFRAFLQHRDATGSLDRAWLIYGHRTPTGENLYGEELASYADSGVLDRVDYAWSRMSDQRYYVQDAVEDLAAEVWDWIEGGATIFVCGSTGMAPGVRAALVRMANERVAVTGEAWLKEMIEHGSYREDVY